MEALDILRQVLTRCRLKNIKLARHKIEFGTEIEYAGVHLGGPEGYRPTTAKIEGIINTPAPTNLTELRSFLGCWNQLRAYIPDYNHSVSHMQTLLKKETPYVWDQLMQNEFEAIKQLLKSPLGLQPFNKDYTTILYTDYSAKGIGYALTQEDPEDKSKKHLIFCGSSSLSEKQKRLPAIYGENLGIVVALQKCRFWLRGCPHFWVYTDHRSLESIYNSKPIDEISDEISDIVVSTYRYNFTVKYVSAKDNLLADFLSRNPIWTQEQEEHGPWIVDDFGKTITVEAHVSSVQVMNFEERLKSDPLLEHIRDQGALDPQYSAVIRAIQEKRTKDWVLNSSENPCREFVSVWDRLGTLDTKDPTLLTLDVRRLVIPIQARKKILEVLHLSHQGMNKTYAAARSRYYWPNLKEDCQQTTQSCRICKEINQKAPTNPNIDPSTPLTDLQPFESVGLDMFVWKNVNYLLVVDRMSGYIFVETLHKNTRCKTVTEKFKVLCLTYGFPREVRYDKGPQISTDFESFLKEILVHPTPSAT